MESRIPPPLRSWVSVRTLFLLYYLTASVCASISNETLLRLPSPNDDFDIHHGALLAPILRTRVPGTHGSTAVLNHFVDFFKTNLPDWTIEFQNSTSVTPTSDGKEIPFVNFVAYRDPPWAETGEVGRLALVAHYDSKLTPDGFIGATDSAAPCAMIMHAARSIDKVLTKKWEAGQSAETMFEEQKGIQIMFLDGEEAFLSWTSTDSLYGARSLAESLESQPHPALSTYKNALSSISLFVLLDLLGAKTPQIPSYFQTTHWAYQRMAKLEERLRFLRRFKSSPNYNHLEDETPELLFLFNHDKAPSSFTGFMIQDDHIPFMARGVEILHLIPIPFPTVWHTIQDDGEHLDINTVHDWALLATAFVAEWLDLEGYFEGETENHPPQPERRGILSSKTEL